MNKSVHQQCHGVTKNGGRCKNRSIDNSKYCHHHSKSIKITLQSKMIDYLEIFLQRMIKFEYKYEFIDKSREILMIFINGIEDNIYEFTNNHIDDFIENLKGKNLDDNDINFSIVILSNFLQFLSNKSIIQVNPLKNNESMLSRLDTRVKNMFLFDRLRWADGLVQRNGSEDYSTEKNKLRALYFPYARSFNTAFLKRIALIFDEVVFIDPLERSVRELIGYSGFDGKTDHKAWNTMKEDYDILFEAGIFSKRSPIKITRDHDVLLNTAVQVDLTDIDFIKACKQELKNNYWGILDIKYIESIEETSSGLFKPSILRISSPFEGIPKYTLHAFDSPFMFRIAHRYVPPETGMAFNINLALLASELWGLYPVTDSPLAIKLLDVKFKRARSNIIESDKDLLTDFSIAEEKSASMLALEISYNLISDSILEKLSFHDIVRIKHKKSKQFSRFRSEIFRLVNTIPVSNYDVFLREAKSLINNNIIKEFDLLKQSTIEVVEDLGLSIANAAIPIATTQVTVLIFTGLTPGEILALSTSSLASSVGLSVPHILKSWKQSRKNDKHYLSYLLI